MPSYVVDLARKEYVPTRQLVFVRSFNIEAESDADAIEKVKALDILFLQEDIDATVIFSADRTRGVWNQMRPDKA